MKCIALKIEKKRSRYLIICLGILIILSGFVTVLTNHWYPALICGILGGGYMIWSAYLEIRIRKELETATMDRVASIRYADKGQYLLMEYDEEQQS